MSTLLPLADDRELHLQGQIGTLNDLLKHTKNEPRLKGPFAFGFYKECLLSCERMLDRLHSMRCVTTRAEWYVLLLHWELSGMGNVS